MHLYKHNGRVFCYIQQPAVYSFAGRKYIAALQGLHRIKIHLNCARVNNFGVRSILFINHKNLCHLCMFWFYIIKEAKPISILKGRKTVMKGKGDFEGCTFEKQMRFKVPSLNKYPTSPPGVTNVYKRHLPLQQYLSPNPSLRVVLGLYRSFIDNYKHDQKINYFQRLSACAAIAGGELFEIALAFSLLFSHE
jgi:hypothetical protein